MNLKRFFKGLVYRINHNCLKAVLTVNSHITKVRSWFYADRILLELPYKGEKILLLALYEKGTLRQDIKNLLRQAKAKNLYVIGVNTQKLLPGNYEGFFDCYIERYNFGRDFASYQCGFNYIFKKKYQQQCPRLLLLNDSVFYESSKLPKFIDDLINTDKEVMGATENYEYEYHIGSFCVSVANRVLQHKNFMRYWQKYRASDVRPTVIQRGEMDFSRCLKKTVINADHFDVLYGVPFFVNALHDPKNIEQVIQYVRRSERLWVQFDVREVWVSFFKQYYISPLELCANKQAIKLEKSALAYAPVYDILQMKEFFETTLRIRDEQLLTRMISFFSARLIWMFRQGSQIHQNNAMLLSLGMPLIKLDGFFRGPTAEEDVLLIAGQMAPTEAAELERLLFSKSYGGDTLTDWKRLLYNHGFI